MFVQQRLQLDLHESEDGGRVPWCCVVSDNSKVPLKFRIFEVQILLEGFYEEVC